MQSLFAPQSTLLTHWTQSPEVGSQIPRWSGASTQSRLLVHAKTSWQAPLRQANPASQSRSRVQSTHCPVGRLQSLPIGVQSMSESQGAAGGAPPSPAEPPDAGPPAAPPRQPIRPIPPLLRRLRSIRCVAERLRTSLHRRSRGPRATSRADREQPYAAAWGKCTTARPSLSNGDGKHLDACGFTRSTEAWRPRTSRVRLHLCSRGRLD